MQQEIKAGGLERLYIACFRPSRYEELLKADALRHILYVCLIVFLQVVIEAILPFSAWDLSVGGISRLVTERLPAFTIENGTMNIEEPVEFELDGVIRVKADSGVSSYKEKNLDESYQEEILFGKENVLLKMGGRVMDISVSELGKDKIDNQSVAAFIPLIRTFVGLYFFSTFLVKGAIYLLAAVFFAFLCQAAIRTPDGKYVTLRGTLVIALYAKTLFTLLNSVNLSLGAPVGETLMLILGTFGTMAFIDRAEAAVLNIKKEK